MYLGPNWKLKTCRLCLSDKVSVCFSIFENNFATMIEALTSRKVSPNDIVTVVCLKCSLNLRMAFNFQQKIKKSEDKLYESIQIKQESYTLWPESVTITEEGDVKIDQNLFEDAVNICDNKCAICGVRVDDNMVNDHIHKHFSDQQTCDSCDASFPNIESYKQHLLEHSERTVHQCDNCKMKFRYKSLYNVHTKTVCFIKKSVQKHIAALDLLKIEEEKRNRRVLNEINNAEAKEQNLELSGNQLQHSERIVLQKHNCKLKFCGKYLHDLMHIKSISSVNESNLHLQKEETNTLCMLSEVHDNEDITGHLFTIADKEKSEDNICTLEREDITLKSSIRRHDGGSCSENVPPINKEGNNSEGTKLKVYKRKLRLTAATHIPETHTCEQCPKQFSSKKTLLSHMKGHRSEKCNICNHYIKLPNYREHVKNHSTGQQVCHLCGATSANRKSLLGHIYSKHKKLGYKCIECDKLFQSKGERASHRKQDHSWKPTHCCETCGNCFYAKKDLQKHIKVTHLKLRPEVCEFCKKSFSSKYALSTHKRQHTKETPFKCEVCGSGYSHKVSLKAHMKSKHDIEEPKTCECKVCGKGFASETGLHGHKRVHWV